MPGGYHPGNGEGTRIAYVTDPETGLGNYESVPSERFTSRQLRALGQALVTATDVGLPSTGAGGVIGINKLFSSGAALTRGRTSFITTPVKPIHKNSNSYVGPTHVYVIRRNGVPYKVGESATGTYGPGNRADLSIRAETQVRNFTRKSNQFFESEIIGDTGGKLSARQFETYLIKEYRKIYGPDSLPGNKRTR